MKVRAKLEANFRACLILQSVPQSGARRAGWLTDWRKPTLLTLNTVRGMNGVEIVGPTSAEGGRSCRSTAISPHRGLTIKTTTFGGTAEEFAQALAEDCRGDHGVDPEVRGCTGPRPPTTTT
ncbi:hypothetical protein K388_05896 [Streptomyces sp. KhCrAH-43]|nr:hypothetical protein K388_05896 [Streptomyces sp. KhCrAH-43]